MAFWKFVGVWLLSCFLSLLIVGVHGAPSWAFGLCAVVFASWIAPDAWKDRP